MVVQDQPDAIDLPEARRPTQPQVDKRRIDSYSLMQTFLASVKNSSESKPPSRPTPLSFIPPKGTRRSRSSQVLTQTVPLSTAAATRWAFWRSRVHTVAERP